jgi:acetyl esterase/lipase
MRFKPSIVFILAFFCLSISVFAQKEIPLYKGPIPNSKPDTVNEKKGSWGKDNDYLENVTKPTLTIFLPEDEKSSGIAVIICPGGGYSAVSIFNEGYQIARAFNKIGVAAFVLKYRLPSDRSMIKKNIGPLQDAQRAIQVVKLNAIEWNIDTAKIGIAGFSAGGHLASSVGTHFQYDYISNPDGVSFRPAFMILGYPVISFADSLTHMGSRNSLIGKKPSIGEIKEFSNELQVSSKTPPTFIFQAEDDRTVKVQNSLVFYDALLKNKVQAEMLIYPKGGHGFGLNNKSTSSKWMDECEKWMVSNGWIKKL